MTRLSQTPTEIWGARCILVTEDIQTQWKGVFKMARCFYFLRSLRQQRHRLSKRNTAHYSPPKTLSSPSTSSALRTPGSCSTFLATASRWGYGPGRASWKMGYRLQRQNK